MKVTLEELLNIIKDVYKMSNDNAVIFIVSLYVILNFLGVI